MTLPIDRTALIAATTNQVPNALIRSALNIAALTTPYDTIDELFAYTAGLVNTDKFTPLGIINVKDSAFGATGDGVTNDTAAIQAAFDAAYLTGGSLFFPPGTFRITSPIGINTTLTASRGMPTITGVKAMAAGNILTSKVQDGSIILYDGVGDSALRINNASTTEFFSGGEIRNISIVKKDGFKSTDGSIGLSLQGCVDYRLYNVVCIGFDIGFKNLYGFSWDAFGITSVHNNVGILLDHHSNSCGLFGVQAHQNNIGIRIKHGENIKIDRATLEGQGHGVVMSKGTAAQNITTVSISNIYGELNTGSIIRIGMDEDGVVSPSEVTNVNIDTVIPIQDGSIIPIQLDYCANVSIKGIVWGHPTDLISVTDNTTNIKVENWTSQYEASYMGSRNSVKNRLGVKNSVNLIPNGFLNAPDLSHFNKDGVTAVRDTTTFPGERVLKITVPDGVTSNANRIGLKIDKTFVNKRVIFHGTAQKENATNFGAFFIFYDSTFSGLVGGAASMPTSMSTIQRNFVVPDGDYIWFTIYVANTSGATRTVYIKNMLLIEQNTGLVEMNPLDHEFGFSGSISATTLGVDVPIPGWIPEMYNVMVTPYGNFTAYVTKAGGSFNIKTVGANGDVGYVIVPKAGILT